MSIYDVVVAELDKGTPAELLCATCPWDRLCVTPPSMTKAEVQEKLSAAEAKDGGGTPHQTLITAIVYAGRDTAGTQCPVFTLRLRGPNGRQVADGIRGLMRDSVGGDR